MLLATFLIALLALGLSTASVNFLRAVAAEIAYLRARNIAAALTADMASRRGRQLEAAAPNTGETVELDIELDDIEAQRDEFADQLAEQDIQVQELQDENIALKAENKRLAITEPALRSRADYADKRAAELRVEVAELKSEGVKLADELRAKEAVNRAQTELLNEYDVRNSTLLRERDHLAGALDSAKATIADLTAQVVETQPKQPRWNEDDRDFALGLIFGDGMNSKQVAAETGIPASTVRTWKRKAVADAQAGAPGIVSGLPLTDPKAMARIEAKVAKRAGKPELLKSPGVKF